MMIHKHITITTEQNEFIESGDRKLSQIVQKRLDVMMMEDAKNETDNTHHSDCTVTYGAGS